MIKTIFAATAVFIVLSVSIPGSADNQKAAGRVIQPSAEISENIQNTIIEKISALPEFKEAVKNIHSKTGSDAGLSFIINNSEDSPDYSVQVGYNGNERFETCYFFHVSPLKYEIKILDITSGEYTAIETWRRSNAGQSGYLSGVEKESDIQLIRHSKNILAVIKARNYKALAAYVHPQIGLRLTPYSFVDVKMDHKLTAADLLDVNQKKKKIRWGEYDGSGEPIIMTIPEYFNRFVYDADFIIKGKITVNEVIQSGNTANNVENAYPGCEFAEFMFPGENPEFEGMDWKVLRLVFKKVKGKLYLIGIIHNEWTT